MRIGPYFMARPPAYNAEWRSSKKKKAYCWRIDMRKILGLERVVGVVPNIRSKAPGTP